MRSKEKEYFDKIANLFDMRFNVYSKSAGISRVHRRLDLFFRHCQLKPGQKILEVGCGTGEYTKGLLKYACSLFCIDISYNMLNKAINKVPKQSNLYFFVGDVEQLSVRDNIFDFIIGNSILHHLNIEKALGQIFRVLKDGGRFAFTEPNLLNPQVFLQKNINFLKKMCGESPEESAFTRLYIKKMFKKAGFRNVSVEPFDFLHPFTPDYLVETINRIGLTLEKILLIKEIAGSLFMTGIK